MISVSARISPIYITKYYCVYFRNPNERVSRVYSSHIYSFESAQEIASAAECDFGYEVEIVEKISTCLYRSTSWK